MLNIAVYSAKMANAFARLESAGLLTDAIRAISEKMAAQVKRNIQTQGKTFNAPWKAASKWTVARTGRERLLQGTESQVRIRHNKDSSEVIFVNNKNWSLLDHHKGFTRPPTNKLEKITLKRPSALGLKKGVVYFYSRKPQRTPARRILPTQQQGRQIAAGVVAQWAKQVRA